MPVSKDQKIQNQAFLLSARRAIVAVLENHPNGLGADELRLHCEHLGIVPATSMLWGAVFKSRLFSRNGDKRSGRNNSHGRWLNIYKIR